MMGIVQERKVTLLNTESEFTCEERLEAANTRIDELEVALRKEIQFKTAKDLRGGEIWLPVLDVIAIFHKAYQLRNALVNNNNRHAKLIFTITNEGRIIDVSPAEGPKEDRS